MTVSLLNPYQYVTGGGGGGGITGFTTIKDIMNSTTSSVGPNTGTITGVVAGQLIVLGIAVLGDSAGESVPSGWTVTVEGNAATYVQGASQTSIFPLSGVFTYVATSSGDLAFSLTTQFSHRAAMCKGLVLSGYNTVTPVANSNNRSNTNTDVTSITFPNGYTPAVAGNVLFGVLNVKGVASAGSWNTGADFLDAEVWDATTGGSASNDIYCGFFSKQIESTSSLTYTANWTTGARVRGSMVEISKA